MDEYLTQVYYNPKRSGSLGGVERLYRDVKKEGKYDISRAQLKKWLMKQDTYTLHKPARRHYKRNRVIVGGIDELWQMDLADMQVIVTENDGYRYLLVCIDVFSKFVWVIPLKTKTGPVVLDRCLTSNSTQGACFCRAAWTPRGKCTLFFVFPTPRCSRTPLIFRGLRA